MAVVVVTAADFETTEYNTQYGLGKINASSVYANGYSGSSVIIGRADAVGIVTNELSLKPWSQINIQVCVLSGKWLI